MPELGLSGSARGAVRNHRPYRDLMHRSKLRTNCDALCDHLIGAGEEGGRDGKAEGLRSFEVHDQLVFGILVEGDITGFGPVKDLGNLHEDLAAVLHEVERIGHEAAKMPKHVCC